VPWDAGDHEVFACRVANFFEDDAGGGPALSTGLLRARGLVTAKGAAAEPLS
jgi:hypothetical protein